MPSALSTLERPGRTHERRRVPGGARCGSVDRLLRTVGVAAAALALAGDAHSSCDVIPGVTQEFRGALGSVNRPFAIPNDDGEEILVRLRPVCEPDSSGFADLPGGLAPEDDYFVTVLFEPPGAGARNAVVLGTETNRGRCQTLAAEAGALPGGGRPCCAGDTNCSAAAAGSLAIRHECVGGSNAGQACTQTAECGEGGACLPFRLRFRFPDTDALVGTPNDDRTFTGPATIAVTAVSHPLPLALATARCADSLGLVACIDELYARDGTCETTPDHIDPTFGHFTALPPANDYQALCETSKTPCTGLQDELRFTVDAAGNALVPMEYRGVLIQADRIPVPRLVSGDTAIGAFTGQPGLPVEFPSEAFLASYAPGGQKLPPIFTPVADPAAEGQLSLFGSVDAPIGVIRVQRRGCAAGAREGASCTQDDECGAGAPCQTLFDFSDRLAGGVGPVLIAQPQFALEAQDPVPLDGLIASEELFAFVRSEALPPEQDCDGDGTLDGTSLNADGDCVDPVLVLRDRKTGKTQAIGEGDAQGRAVARLREGRFRPPAVVAEGDLVGFLEPEPLERRCDDPPGCDANGDRDAFDSILRLYRLAGSCPSSGPCRAEALPVSTPAGSPLAVDAAPLVEARPLAISDGLVFFRVAEWMIARQRTVRVSVDSTGSELPELSLQSSISADGRLVAFTNDALVDGVFLHDRDLDADGVFDERSPGSFSTIPVRGFTRIPFAGNSLSLSADGKVLAFGEPVVVRKLSSGQTFEIGGTLPFAGHALSEGGRFLVVGSLFPALASSVFDLEDGPVAVGSLTGFAESISADGRFVTLDGLPGPVSDRIAVHDRRTGESAIVGEGNLAASVSEISPDGRFVAFGSTSPDLVAGDTNDLFELFVFDRQTGETRRVPSSAGVSWAGTFSRDGRFLSFLASAGFLNDSAFVYDQLTDLTYLANVRPNGTSGGSFVLDTALSGDGRHVAFTSYDFRLVTGDNNQTFDVFVRGPAPGDLASDLSGDGDLDDTLLQVLDTGSPGSAPTTLGPAGRVAVAAGAASFLFPEAAERARPDGNGDGDSSDSFVWLALRGAAPLDLAKQAVDLAMSPDILAARVPAPDGGEAFAEVCDWREASPTCWRALGSRARGIAAARGLVALLAPECPFDSSPGAACPAGGQDLNGDGDQADSVVRLYRTDAGRAVEVPVAQAAEEFVLGERLLAFRTREANQGRNFSGNGDSDRGDDVLQVLDLVSRPERVLNTEQAVTPCPLEACDPRFPYRVAGDTVTFITAEVEQGGSDLNGDGDATDLVKQVFNAREAARVAPPSGEAGGCVEPVASASAGICTTTGTSCARDADCGAGTCYLPPGGCVITRGGSCTCHSSGCSGCLEAEFCQPLPNAGGRGICKESLGPCASQLDCAELGGEECRDSSTDIQRLFSPLAAAVDSGDAVSSSGTCVEDRGRTCARDADCREKELCGTSGTCERRHGACVEDADCAAGRRCAHNIVVAAADDVDLDELLDPFDNCPEVANADQADLDGDDLGDACDLMTCGNAALEFSEECDDGNRMSGDCCSDACRITDQTPPVLSCSAMPIREQKGRHQEDDRRGWRGRDDDDDDDREKEDREDRRGARVLRIGFAASDACGPVQPESAIDLGCSEVPVSDGQLVAFERGDDCEAERERRALEIESRRAVLRVDATDAAGNSATCMVDLAAGGEGTVTAGPPER